MHSSYQIHQARAWGADVILLIAACLTPAQTQELAHEARETGMEVLLEVHGLEEAESHYNSYCNLLGVNNRNLKTFKVDIDRSIAAMEHLPEKAFKISESGLSHPDAVHKLKKAGYQGFLMGEAFMKTKEPAKALEQFLTDLQ